MKRFKTVTFLGRTCALLARAQLLTTFTSPRSAIIKSENWGFRTALIYIYIYIHMYLHGKTWCIMHVWVEKAQEVVYDEGSLFDRSLSGYADATRPGGARKCNWCCA